MAGGSDGIRAYFATQAYSLAWTSPWVSPSDVTDIVPDTDTEIPVEQARSIAIQIDSTNAGHAATDCDLNVQASLDGTNWDTVPYAERNFGDAELKSLLVEPGPQKLRLRLDNNTTTALTGEVIGAGDGTTTAFSGTLAHALVRASSITIHYTISSTDYTATDDGAGNISGPSVSGTINYTTGAWTLTFTTAPDDATNITADYSYVLAIDLTVRVLVRI